MPSQRSLSTNRKTGNGKGYPHPRIKYYTPSLPPYAIFLRVDGQELIGRIQKFPIETSRRQLIKGHLPVMEGPSEANLRLRQVRNVDDDYQNIGCRESGCCALSDELGKSNLSTQNIAADIEARREGTGYGYSPSV